MTTLDRKLLRDLGAMRGQAVTIALVVGLRRRDLRRRDRRPTIRCSATQDASIMQPASPTCSPPLKRAPLRWPRASPAPGHRRVETRVVEDVTIDLPGVGEPLTGAGRVAAGDRARRSSTACTCARGGRSRRARRRGAGQRGLRRRQRAASRRRDHRHPERQLKQLHIVGDRPVAGICVRHPARRPDARR